MLSRRDEWFLCEVDISFKGSAGIEICVDGGFKTTTLVSSGHSLASQFFEEVWIIPALAGLGRYDRAHFAQLSGIGQKWPLETRVVENIPHDFLPTTLISSGQSMARQLFNEVWVSPALGRLGRCFKAHLTPLGGLAQKWPLETRVVENILCEILPTTLVSSGHSLAS